MDKTIELRVKGGKYEANKAPPLSRYVDYTIADDAKKELGIK